MRTTIFTALAFFLAVSFLLSSCKEKEEVPSLLARNAHMQRDADKGAIDAAYNDAVIALKKNPEDMQQYINLASAFVAEGRATGNSAYYNNAALEMLEKVLQSKTANTDLTFQALSLRSAILLNYHQFRHPLDAAEKGLALNNYNSGIYGALVDANVELGNYNKAVEYCDKMLSLRPDLRSYSRASYLRQIFGQNRGAIDTMVMAVDAGVPGAESTEWARTNLGNLYLANGNLDSASIIYRTSLVYRPGYPFALVGMAKVAKLKKDYNAAITYTRQAIELMPDASFVSLLADIYELQGNMAKAKSVRTDVVRLVEKGKKDEAAGALAKHNVNRELATACMHTGDLEKALGFALTDLQMRPGNIDANDLVAWIYYLKGDKVNAKKYIDKVFVTHINDADLLYKASLIYAKAGERQRSDELMRNAMSVNPLVGESFISSARYASAR